MSEAKHAIARAPGAERIRAAWLDATQAFERAKDKALYCGFLLLEQREHLSTGRRNKFDPTKPEDERLSLWLEANLPEIPRPTAYRWMAAAERAALASGLGTVIDVDGQQIPASSLITMPAAELPEPARKAQQLWLDFVQDKTLNDCLTCVLDGDKAAHAITRAWNGKHARGAGSGGDRKAFVAFIGLKLRHITTFLTVRNRRQPLTFREFDPADRGKIAAKFDAALERWPRWLLTSIAEKAKAELKLSDEERIARKGDE